MKWHCEGGWLDWGTRSLQATGLGTADRYSNEEQQQHKEVGSASPGFNTVQILLGHSVLWTLHLIERDDRIRIDKWRICERREPYVSFPSKHTAVHQFT